MPFDKSFYPSIHTAPSAGGPLLPWSELKFNPVGLCNLRNRLGLFPKEPGIFTRHQDRFLASDIAWFAAGASDDDNHYVRPDTFHPLFNVCRETLPTGRQGNQLWTSFRQNLQQLTFDMATTWDRAYGGSTFIIHIDGTTVPGVPLLPEFLKANVYIPPHLLIEQPECERSIAAIVQAVIENIGIPTVRRWRQAARGIGWSLSQKGHILTPSQHIPLIPPPVSPGSASYTFRGRQYGSLPLLIPSLPVDDPSTTSFHSSSSSTSTVLDTLIPPSSPSSDMYFPDEPDPVELALISATERIAYLEEHLELANQKGEEYMAIIKDLRNEMSKGFTMKREYSQFSPMTPTRQARQVSSSFASPQTPHAATTLHFPKVDVSMFPRPSPARFQSKTSAQNLSPAPNAKQKGKADSTVLHKLGRTTLECLTKFNLTHLTEMVELIVQYNPPPLWGARLATISISESDREALLVALADDWEAYAEK